ncbi:MAG: cytochrome c biogenesis protein CcsA [Armatimonadetes bacterium]|nr:cytochrome c biogenesis protein CcsA [Armatimonadota bacterium]MDE2206568.1 cytochrome c biogenesis protein CcsA [Armatimonadota bacterium]
MQHLGALGVHLLVVGVFAAPIAALAYLATLRWPNLPALRWVARGFFGLTAACILATFGTLADLIYHRQYEYIYVFSHTGNDLHGWYRLAATWSGQEGSFLLWGSWTSIIGVFLIARAGKWESRVMPIYVTVMGFLCAILIKQTPFGMIPIPSKALLAAHPGWHYPPLDGQGLVPSLVNYWMTIHPPTIFFAFSSLLVPFSFAIAALLWSDYDDWVPRVMPFALLSCAVLGLGLFMGGYWAYETQGWHGFWAWDPVENASFFPWLAVTAMVHGLVAQRNRHRMRFTNLLLGITAFWLFLVGTFLTRSGALAGKAADGQMLSVHAFDDIGKSALWLMAAMVLLYGSLGFTLWFGRLYGLVRWRLAAYTGSAALFVGGVGLRALFHWPQVSLLAFAAPGIAGTLVLFGLLVKRSASADRPVPAAGGKLDPIKLLSRDAASVIAITMMVVACFVITLATTRPLFLSWMHQPPEASKPVFYNRFMLPMASLAALIMGFVPWLAWKQTNFEKFARKLMAPWMIMVLFGFGLLIWVLGAERASLAALAADPVASRETLRAWFSPRVETAAVVLLGSLGFFAALSNAMLAYKAFRAKPLSAGGWIAHVGIGVLMLGIIVANSFERTDRFVLEQGQAPQTAFGYHFEFVRMTGKPIEGRPVNPDYDENNRVVMQVTPPGSIPGGPDTFTIDPKWFVYNLDRANEQNLDRMRWPSIRKYLSHDLYVGFASDPEFEWPSDGINPNQPGITMKVGERRQLGDYMVGYYKSFGTPGKIMGARVIILTPDHKIVQTTPAIRMDLGSMLNVDDSIPDIPSADGTPSAIYLDRLDPITKTASLRLSLPGYAGRWVVPLEVTYKPWISLVWLGVLITVGGALLAMANRALEARRYASGLAVAGPESATALPIATRTARRGRSGGSRKSRK